MPAIKLPIVTTTIPDKVFTAPARVGPRSLILQDRHAGYPSWSPRAVINKNNPPPIIADTKILSTIDPGSKY